MSSFEILILSSPSGFQKGCVELNSLFVNDLDLFTRIMDLNDDYHNENTFKTMKYIYNSYKLSKPKVDSSSIANILDTKSFLSRECIEKIVGKLDQYGQNNDLLSLNMIKTTSNHMVNFKWKIGLSINSNRCDNLRSPFVKISYDIQSPSGNLTPFSAELTIEQFKVISC